MGEFRLGRTGVSDIQHVVKGNAAVAAQVKPMLLLVGIVGINFIGMDNQDKYREKIGPSKEIKGEN